MGGNVLAASRCLVGACEGTTSIDDLGPVHSFMRLTTFGDVSDKGEVIQMISKMEESWTKKPKSFSNSGKI